MNEIKGLWRNKKTGNVYGILADNIINATNAVDGQKCVVYVPVVNGARRLEWFIRERNEFLEKFEKVEK